MQNCCALSVLKYFLNLEIPNSGFLGKYRNFIRIFPEFFRSFEIFLDLFGKFGILSNFFGGFSEPFRTFRELLGFPWYFSLFVRDFRILMGLFRVIVGIFKNFSGSFSFSLGTFPCFRNFSRFVRVFSILFPDFFIFFGVPVMARDLFLDLLELFGTFCDLTAFFRLP